MMGFDPARAWLGRLRRDLAWMWGLRGLRRRVLWFHWRARRQAHRTNDLFSVVSVTRPADMQVLLKLARGRSHVVEIGTATAWTAITLALDDRRRRVVTYDVIEREEARRYLDSSVRTSESESNLWLRPVARAPGTSSRSICCTSTPRTRVGTRSLRSGRGNHICSREHRCSSMITPTRTIQGCAKQLRNSDSKASYVTSFSYTDTRTWSRRRTRLAPGLILL
jgi:hypothetical protein